MKLLYRYSSKQNNFQPWQTFVSLFMGLWDVCAGLSHYTRPPTMASNKALAVLVWSGVFAELTSLYIIETLF